MMICSELKQDITLYFGLHTAIRLLLFMDFQFVTMAADYFDLPIHVEHGYYVPAYDLDFKPPKTFWMLHFNKMKDIWNKRIALVGVSYIIS